MIVMQPSEPLELGMVIQLYPMGWKSGQAPLDSVFRGWQSYEYGQKGCLAIHFRDGVVEKPQDLSS